MAKKAEQQENTAILEVPLADVGEHEYLSRHVETRFKTERQKLTFRRVLRGLQTRGAKTEDGRPVMRPGDVIRWLVENMT